MTQYAKHIEGKVLGFFESDEELPQVEDGVSAQVMSILVTSYPQAPSKTCELHIDEVGNLEWVETATLDELKISKNGEINSARLAANRSFFTFAGKEIACDELSRSDIDAISSEVSLTQTLPATFPGGWKAVDNTYVAIPDVATWILFVKAMVQKGSSNFAHAQALKGQLASAETPEDISAIQWQT